MFSNLRGSVILPVITAAAAVSGLTRYTFALFVPHLPLKFLLFVLRDIAFVPGAKLLPMQNPQADSKIRAPAFTSVSRPPCLSIISITCLEPGATPNSMSGCATLPFNIWATVIRSRYEEFVQLPTAT